MKILVITMCLGLVFTYRAGATDAAPKKTEKMDWSPCAKEIDKYCKRVKEKSDRKIYECLSEHDEHHDNGLTEKCDKDGHTKYESMTGTPDTAK